MAVQTTLHMLAEEIGRLLLPLRRALAEPAAFRQFVAELGWATDAIPPPVLALGQELDELSDTLDAVATEPSPSDLVALLQAVRAVLSGIEELGNETFDPELAVDRFAEEFPRQLIEHLVVEYLDYNRTRLAYLLRALALIRVGFVASAGNRPHYLERRLDWAHVPLLLRDPAEVFKRSLGWGTPHLDSRSILEHIQDLAFASGLQVYLEPLEEAAARVLEGEGGLSGDPLRWSLEVPFFEGAKAGARVTAGVGLFPLPADSARLPGMALLPFADAGAELGFEFAPGVNLRVSSQLDLRAGVGLLLRPDEALETLVGLADPASASSAKGRLIARLDAGATSSEPRVLLGIAGGSRLEAAGLAAVGGLHLDAQDRSDLHLEVELRGGKLVVAPGEGDAFFQRILPADGVAVRFDAAVGLSSERGFYFRGSSALEATFPTHFSAGGVKVNSVTVAVRPEDEAIGIEAGAAVSANLGPLTATVENVGLRADLGFPGAGGNLGPVDVDLGFKPPDGVGLAIRGGGFSGGGFLRFEPDEDRYSGLLELEFEGRFTVKALGLLTTKLPGGKPGFSLLISLSGEFTPVQLGLGFTLNGVGGLLGLNRTVDIERLRRGVKERTLDNVLFPTDLVANADRILSDLRQVFPPSEGRFTFGPMAIIGWGTPTLITIELGLVVEVPSPVRAALLGVLKSLLPDEERRLVVLQVNFLGALELEKRQISFDASLFDSRLLTYTLAGDMAVRVAWGENPNLLLTVGGFHPDYEPPPLALPALQRITVNLLGGKNPRLTLESYYAITSNTVQFGARVELYAKVSKFNVYGFLGFDALFQFNPFHFVAALDAGLAVRIGSRRIMGVKFSGSLEGPTPWKAKGKATFKIVFVKFKVRFDKTFGEARDTRLPDVEVKPLLLAALRDRGSWSSEFPARLSQLVSLKEVSGPTARVLVDPVGTLTVSQRVAPLGITLTRFGNRRPRGANRFTITRVSSAGDSLDQEPAREQFAPAQFQEFDDQERLSRKSFEKLESGVRVAAAQGLGASRAVTRDVRYERQIIDRAGRRRRGFFHEGLLAFEELTAAAAGPSSELGRSRPPASPLAPARVAVAAEGFAVVRTRDLTRVDGSAPAPTQAEAVDLLREISASRPERAEGLQVVPVYEVNAP